MVFHWSLSDSKSPQVSMTRLRILAALSKAVVWIVSTRPPTSKSSRPFNNHLVIVPKAPITTGTIVTFMYHSFFNSLSRTRYLSFFSLSFRFILWSAGTAKSTILQIMFSYGPPHMAEQGQDDQLEHTYSSYVRTCQRRWTIGRSGERGSRISVLAARHDDDDYKVWSSGRD